MYLDEDNFEKWMQKLSKKLSEIGQDLKSLINTKEVFSEDETLLDKRFSVPLESLKAHAPTVQVERKTPLFLVSHKTYYRTSDVREFVRTHMDFQTYQEFEKKHSKPKDEDKKDE